METVRGQCRRLADRAGSSGAERRGAHCCSVTSTSTEVCHVQSGRDRQTSSPDSSRPTWRREPATQGPGSPTHPSLQATAQIRTISELSVLLTHFLNQTQIYWLWRRLTFIIIIIIIIIKRVLLECRWVKITSRTLYKWNSKIKCSERRWKKVKIMTWQKDAFSGDAWRCRVSQTQWRWMAKCSRRAVHRPRTHNLQSSYDTMMAPMLFL